MVQPLTILVVDDDELVREAYRSFFSHRPDFLVAGEARDGAAVRDEEVLRVTALEDAEVVLVDAA